MNYLFAIFKQGNIPGGSRASLGVPENSAFMDVEKILKIVYYIYFFFLLSNVEIS